MSYQQELLSDWCKANNFDYEDKADHEGNRYSAITVTEESLIKFQNWVIEIRAKWNNLQHYFLSSNSEKWYEIKDHICQLADEVYYFSKRKQGYERLEFEEISVSD